MSLFVSPAVAIGLVPTSEFGPLDERGLDGPISSAVLFQGRVVVCGTFDQAGSTAAPSHIAAWNGHWETLPAVPIVGPLFVHDGQLYSNKYRLVNDVWVELPPPAGLELQNVEAACTLAHELVIAGLFRDTLTDVVSRAVYAFDSVSWRPLATALAFANTSGTLNALHVHDGDLILGARYLESIDGVAVENVARHDGGQWSAMGSLPHFVLALESFQGELYASARYDLYDGMYRWNNPTWGLVANLTLPIRDLHATDDALYAGGRFDTIDGQSIPAVARYDGANWSELGDGLCLSNVFALVSYGQHLYAAGDVRCSPPTLVHMTEWDGIRWRPMIDGGLGLWSEQPQQGVMTFLAHEGKTVAAGEFDRWGQPGDYYRVDARSVGALVDQQWEPMSLPTADGAVVDLAEHDGALFAVGVDRSVTTHAQIWRWMNGSWATILGSSFGQSNFVVGDLRAVESYGGDLIFAGNIVLIGPNPWTDIARWDGIGFGGVGGGPAGPIDDLIQFDGNLVAGGTFTTSAGVPTNNVARWDGLSWTPMGNGLNGRVSVLTLHDGDLYAGGDFTFSGSTPIAHVARWDGIAWQPLGAGVNGAVVALAPHEGRLFVLGNFSSAGGQPATDLASWSLAGGWAGYDLVTNGTPMAIHSTPQGLLLGGSFTQTTVGGHTETAHEIARLVSETTSAPAVPGRVVTLRVQATPNPFNPRVRVSFEMKTPAPVEVELFDARGRMLRNWSLGQLPEGTQHVDWDGLDRRGEAVASGVYLFEVVAGEARGVTRAVLLR